jgi:hypothetical protein
MERIKLIVTGNMERLALHHSLRQFFPPIRNNKKVEWEAPRQLNCATTLRLPQKVHPIQKPPSMRNKLTPMEKLAQAMLDEAITGKTGKPADLVIVIDDVELENLERENIIAEHFRAAVHSLLENKYSNDRKEIREKLREKCSFHVLKPMIESYLFGDAHALQLVGVPNNKTPKLVHSDVEQFKTDDPDWLPICLMENEKRKQSKPWWCHECHPKHYLDYLIEGEYKESKNGKHALQELNWKEVTKTQTHTIFIRSLFEDIAAWFDVQNPFTGETSPYFYPDKSVKRANLLLRNM